MRVGMTILYNGRHTVEACIRNTLRFCDRVVVIYGRVEALSGMPPDGSLGIVERMARAEKRIKLINPGKVWSEKLEMVRQAEPEFEDGWLIQVDCDEFYHPIEMDRVIVAAERLERKDIEFYAHHFFGSVRTVVPMVDGRPGNLIPWRRCFRVMPGDRWLSHQPPRIEGPDRSILTRDITADLGVFLYHYGYVWRSQCEEKIVLHGQRGDQIGDYDRASIGELIPMGKDCHLIPFDGNHPVDVNEFRE